MMNDNWIIIATTLGGIGFGFGCASVVYIRIFVRQLNQLHDDNVETASLLVIGDAETARLLVHSDKNRASEVEATATDLMAADENVTRMVTENNGGTH